MTVVKMKVNKGKKFAIVLQDGEKKYRTKKGTFRSVSREIRKKDLIPCGAHLNKKGETCFK